MPQSESGSDARSTTREIEPQYPASYGAVLIDMRGVIVQFCRFQNFFWASNISFQLMVLLKTPSIGARIVSTNYFLFCVNGHCGVIMRSKLSAGSEFQNRSRKKIILEVQKIVVFVARMLKSQRGSFIIAI